MNISKIKQKIKTLIDKNVSILVNVGRNKEEYYEGVITRLYPNIFIVEMKDFVKSFTYSDVLTKNVVIKEI